jgi:hypothetical protein
MESLMNEAIEKQDQDFVPSPMCVTGVPKAEIQPIAITPMTMLSMAVSQGADLDKLEKLMALQERWEANEARKAFNDAMGAFRAEGITVAKDSRVTYKTDKGVTDYVHASLGNICNVVGAAMAKYGLSYRWNTQQTEGLIKVTCVVSHKQGHSESVSLQASADSSGGKNNIQAIGSTVSYLERYTLLAATGTATEYQDDDGRGSDPIEYISANQEADLTALLDEVGANKKAFMDYFKIDKIEDLPADEYKKAVAMSNAKRQKDNK